MGFLRFRRSLRLLPGLRVNLGKRGASVSVGVRGAHVTVGRTGTRTTVGLPGTGLSYTELHKPVGSPAEAQDEDPAQGSSGRGWLWIAAIVLIAIALAFASGRASAAPSTAGHADLCGRLDASIRENLREPVDGEPMASRFAAQANEVGCYTSEGVGGLAWVWSLLALAVAIWGTSVSVRQHRVAREKLRLDLFEKRFQIFEAARKLASVASQQAFVTDQDLWRFRGAVIEKEFLFGPDLIEYLNEMDLQAVKASVYGRPSDAQTEKALENQQIGLGAQSWLMDQLKHLHDRFAPYLRFDQQVN